MEERDYLVDTAAQVTGQSDGEGETRATREQDFSYEYSVAVQQNSNRGEKEESGGSGGGCGIVLQPDCAVSSSWTVEKKSRRHVLRTRTVNVLLCRMCSRTRNHLVERVLVLVQARLRDSLNETHHSSFLTTRTQERAHKKCYSTSTSAVQIKVVLS